MKTKCVQFIRARGLRAMTFVEMMTTVGLFSLAVGGILSVNMFGLRQDELVNSKLGASDQSRTAFNLLLDEIRSAKNVQIGFGWNTNFAPITNGLQQGDTLQLIPSTNYGAFLIYYYFNTNTAQLIRSTATNNTVLSSSVICSYLTNMPNLWLSSVTGQLMTNSMCFQAFGFNGSNWSVLTTDPTNYTTHNYIVSTLLQFFQYQYPMTKVGSNYLYDYYQLQLQAARRSP